MTSAAVSAVEADYVVVLILNPDTPEEPPLARLSLWRDVENQAAHLADKFALNIVELVVLLVESVGVDKDHLQEAVGQELHGERKEIADGAENFLSLALGIAERNKRDSLRKLRATEKILVAGGDFAQIFVRLQVLNVRLHQRRILPDLLVQPVLVGDDPVDDLVHRPRLLRFWPRCVGDGRGPS